MPTEFVKAGVDNWFLNKDIAVRGDVIKRTKMDDGNVEVAGNEPELKTFLKSWYVKHSLDKADPTRAIEFLKESLQGGKVVVERDKENNLQFHDLTGTALDVNHLDAIKVSGIFTHKNGVALTSNDNWKGSLTQTTEMRKGRLVTTWGLKDSKSHILR